MEEYGTGRYSRKHSTFYKAMMEELGLNTSEATETWPLRLCLCCSHHLDVGCWYIASAAVAGDDRGDASVL
jgi:hypothetical protein